MRTSAPETIEYSLAANAINFPLMAACRAAEIMPKLKAAAKTNPNVRLVQYGIKRAVTTQQCETIQRMQAVNGKVRRTTGMTASEIRVGGTDRKVYPFWRTRCHAERTTTRQ